MSKKFSAKKINLVKWWIHAKSAKLMRIVIYIQIYSDLPAFSQFFNPFCQELLRARVRKAVDLLYDLGIWVEDCAIKMQLQMWIQIAIRRSHVWVVWWMLPQIPLQSVERPASHCANIWSGIILMKDNHLLSELVFSFSVNGIINSD